jgi:Ca-activated chloride channel family protein
VKFLWPELLWLLLAVPLVAAAYVVAMRRRRRSALRYANLTIVRAALAGASRVRRDVPP